MGKTVYKVEIELVCYYTCDEMLRDVEEKVKVNNYSKVKKYEHEGCWYAEFTTDIN